jgi:hypothetical protein
MTQTTDQLVIDAPSLCGHFAMWAVRQSPYPCPDNLAAVLGRLKVAATAWCAHDPYTVSNFPMRMATQHELTLFVHRFVHNDPDVQAWNQPRSGHTAAFIVVSRYDRPAPDDDIIDLDALTRNVCRTTWEEQARDAAWDAAWKVQTLGRSGEQQDDAVLQSAPIHPQEDTR